MKFSSVLSVAVLALCACLPAFAHEPLELGTQRFGLGIWGRLNSDGRGSLDLYTDLELGYGMFVAPELEIFLALESQGSTGDLGSGMEQRSGSFGGSLGARKYLRSPVANLYWFGGAFFNVRTGWQDPYDLEFETRDSTWMAGPELGLEYWLTPYLFIEVGGSIVFVKTIRKDPLPDTENPWFIEARWPAPRIGVAFTF